MTYFPNYPPRWADSLPGYLAFFDLADLKRRNWFLGHLHGDQDIAEFDALLRQCVGSSEFVVRWGGDEWLAFLPGSPEQMLMQVIDLFKQAMPIRFGWQCNTVRHAGETLQMKHTKLMTIHRGVRCAYAGWSEPAQFNAVCRQLDERVYRSAVNTVSSVDQSEFAERDIAWRCVPETFAGLEHYCPFCYSVDLELEDDECSGFCYGSGTCKSCRAQLEFRDYVEKEQML